MVSHGNVPVTLGTSLCQTPVEVVQLALPDCRLEIEVAKVSGRSLLVKLGGMREHTAQN